MTEPTNQLALPEPSWVTEEMLRRRGMYPLSQEEIEMYARTTLAEKGALGLQWGAEERHALRAWLRQEHPDCSERELTLLVIKHLYGIRVPDKERDR
ncbi:MAG: hypothetical protein ACJ78Q_06675 [Chloroflexia bacterium]